MKRRCYFFIILFIFFDSNAVQQKFTLFTMLYNEQNQSRVNEYTQCLTKNMKNSSIESIHVFYDTSSDKRGNHKILNFLEVNKIVTSKITGRASFQYFFDFANEHYPESAIIISNADIYFDQTLSLLETFDLSNVFISLTRWEVERNKDPHIEYWHGFSHDVWIFNTPMPVMDANLLLGVFGVDGALPTIVARYGFVQLNPALDIKAYHLHQSQVRNIPRFNYFKFPQMSIELTKLPIKQ